MYCVVNAYVCVPPYAREPQRTYTGVPVFQKLVFSTSLTTYVTIMRPLMFWTNEKIASIMIMIVLRIQYWAKVLK